MKKKVLVVFILCFVFLSACTNNPESTNEIDNGEAQQQSSNDSASQIGNDNVKIDNDNPIDIDLSNSYANAKDTASLNAVSQEGYNSWKSEYLNITQELKDNYPDSYNIDDYNYFNDVANQSYSHADSNGGSLSYSQSLANTTLIYKQAVYYFKEVYKSATGEEYVYIYK